MQMKITQTGLMASQVSSSTEVPDTAVSGAAGIRPAVGSAALWRLQVRATDDAALGLPATQTQKPSPRDAKTN